MTRKTKWYSTWGFRISVVAIIILLIFGGKEAITHYNYVESLKTHIKSQDKKIETQDSLYKIKAAQKEKIKIVREKISIQSELDRLEHLKNQLLELRKQPPKQIDTISPEELDKYFKNLLKQK